jgi:polyvinyl alcohol dehydrogenase (cytochrome)
MVAGLLTVQVGAALAAAPAADHPGAAVYQQFCAGCHDQPETTRAPGKRLLEQMNGEALRLSLTRGVMAQQGEALS